MFYVPKRQKSKAQTNNSPERAVSTSLSTSSMSLSSRTSAMSSLTSLPFFADGDVKREIKKLIKKIAIYNIFLQGIHIFVRVVNGNGPSYNSYSEIALSRLNH